MANVFKLLTREAFFDVNNMEGFMPAMDFGMAMGMADMGIGPGAVDGMPPGWDGGHNFNGGIARYALNEFVIPEVQADLRFQNSTHQEIVTEARHRLAMRLWEGRTFFNRERRREPEMTREWEITETSPGVRELTTMYADKRVSLRELWENTRRVAHDRSHPETYNPKAFNGQEMKAQLAMQDALIHGRATAAVTFISDADNPRRYAQLWNVDDKGKISTKFLDVGKIVGRDFSPEEAETVLQHVGRLYGDKRIDNKEHEYPVVLLREGKIRSEEVQTIAKLAIQAHDEPTQSHEAQEIESTRRAETTAILGQTEHQAPSLTDRILADMQEVARRSGKGIINEVTVTIDAVRSHDVKETSDKKKVKEMPLYMRILLGKVAIPQQETMVLANIMELPEVTLKEDKEQVEKAEREAQEIIAISLKTDVGIAAAILMLGQFVESAPHPEEVSVNQLMDLQQDEEVTVAVTPELHEAVFEFLSKEKNDSFESIQVNEHRFMLADIDLLVLGRLKEVVQTVDQMTAKEALEAIENKEQVVILEMSDLWEVFSQMSEERRLKSAIAERNTELEFASDQDTEIGEKNEREHIENFSFAFTLWMLLKLDSYYHSLQSLKLFIFNQIPQLESKNDTSLNLLDILKQEIPEGLVQKETTQWILLGIIWHLAMIREQGIAQSQNQTQQSVQKKSIQVQGVIFAYAT